MRKKELSIPIKWGCVVDYDFSKMFGKESIKGIVKIKPKEWNEYCKSKQKFMKWHYKLLTHIHKGKQKKLNIQLDKIQKEINEVKIYEKNK